LTQKQSTTRRIARFLGLSKFAFSAQTAFSSALFRLAKQTKSSDTIARFSRLHDNFGLARLARVLANLVETEA